MSLGYKITIIILCTFLLFAGLNYVALQKTISPSFNQLEQDAAIQAGNSFVSTIRDEFEKLIINTVDWGQWDLTYEYMVDRSDDYIEDNYLPALNTFLNLDIELLFIVDLDGNIVWGKVYDTPNKIFRSISYYFPDIESLLAYLLTHTTEEQNHHGLVKTEQGPMLLSSNPILTNSKEGPMRGIMVMGRLLSGHTYDRILTQTQSEFSYWSTDINEQEILNQENLNTLPKEGAFITKIQNNKLLNTYTFIPYLYPEGGILFRIDRTRSINVIADKTIKLTLYMNTAIIIILMALLLLLLRFTVTEPLRKLTQKISEIEVQPELDEAHFKSISKKRNDEIGTLANEFYMLLKNITSMNKKVQKEVAERKHISTILSLENKYLEMITQDSSMNDILDSILIDIEEILPESLSSILLLDKSGMHLHHGSAPRLPQDYTDAIDGVKIGPNVGSCGTAAYLNKQIVVKDIEHDPLWAGYKEIALKHGLKACWSTPISIPKGSVLGTFALYFKEVKEPDIKSFDLIHRIANIVAILILRKQSQEQLSFHASHDALTGLINRREFEHRVERLLSSTQNYDSSHALLFMDLDQFKVVNDHCGHTAGDELLRQLGTMLNRIVRKQDTLARIGGDEFAVLMEHCSLEQAQRVSRSILEAVQDFQFPWDNHNFKIGVSIGLIPITPGTINLVDLLRNADAACYMAKESGRNRIHVYQAEDSETAQRHGEMRWVARINKALEENRFCLYTQAIVPTDCNNDSIHHEVLIRMIDDSGEHIAPGAFLPAAERYSLISKIDLWVIENTFHFLTEHTNLLPENEFFSINISGHSLTTPEVLQTIRNFLKEFNLAGKHICFEITETAAISNLSIAEKFIKELKQYGCKFALDDFGSGLSSFAYLKYLSVNYLKIDGIFVKDILYDKIDFAMVKSINEIGHVMGMKTIAEFVENDEIKDKLKELSVDYVQGFGISKPVPIEETLLSNHKTYTAKA